MSPTIKIYVSALVIVMLAIHFNVVHAVGAENLEASTNLSSRYILWDSYEKMIDPSFNITVYCFNSSSNFTAWFEIGIDNNITTGEFQFINTINFTIKRTIINDLYVKINNKTYLSAQNILIAEGITTDNITPDNGHSLTINLLPSEWTKKEWNIFFGIVSSFLLSLPICYFGIKTSRQIVGYKTIR